MDRFEEIKDLLQNKYKRAPAFENMTDWLIAEVDRLRKIEDVAWHFAGALTYPEDRHLAEDTFRAVLKANPRPESDDA